MKRKLSYILQPIWQHHRGIAFLAFICFTLEAILQYSQPYVIARIFSQSLLDQFSWGALGQESLLLLGVILSGVLVQTLAIRFDIDFLAQFAKTLMFTVYQKLLYFDITLHENESSGKYLGKTRRAVDKITSGVDQMLYQFLPATVEVIFVHGVFFWYTLSGGWWLTVSLVFLLSFAFFVSLYLNRVFTVAFEQETKVSAYFVESLSLIRTIRFFSKEDHYRERGDAEFSAIPAIWQAKLPRLTLLLGLKNLFLWLQGFIFAVLIVWQYRLGVLTNESGLFLLILVPLYVRSLGSLSRLVDRMAEFMTALDQYASVLDQKEQVTDQASVRALPEPVQGQISFDRVTFSYEGAENNQYNDFSLSFQPKKVTALVGASGSGKSTLVKLLFRLYDVNEGAVRLDGIDIREFAQRDYRKLLAIVPQDVELFNASVRENLLMGDSFSDADVWKALGLAVLDERVRSMPATLDTEVGERGVKLSGGEKQRLGIARALIRQPKILVLDEATSSLDTLSERQVKEAIYNLEHLDITVIVIAHRLSTIRDADEILVFEQGSVVERGTHEFLMQQKRKYFALQGEQIVNL
ncbi:MAG: ABC transporter ATP-binding protein [Candidatus Moraniibacteriota bacterium]